MKNNYISEVEDFVAWANVFCEIIDHHNTYSKQEFLIELAKALSSLYYSGLMLPDIELISDVEIRDFATSNDRAKIHNEIAVKLGDYNYYWEIFNPYKLDDPVTSSIGDDLSDIYSDVKNGIELYRKETDLEIAEAIWYWRFSFYTHFGKHIVSALRAINNIIMDY